LYWNCKEYIGLGAAGCGYLNGVRYKNPDNLQEYLDMTKDSSYSQIRKQEHLSEKDFFVERIILGLRLVEAGLNLDEVYTDFGYSKKLDKQILDFINTGFLTKENSRVKLTHKGIVWSNHVFRELID
ncbi:hypothetical protein ACFL5N_02975, partial [bacterium]